MKRVVYAIVVIAVVIAAGLWWWLAENRKNGIETLVLAPRELVQEVSVSGQVRPATSVNLSFKQSGRVASVAVEAGMSVAAGQVLMNLENSAEERAVREAELALATAELALEKLLSSDEQQVEEGKLVEAYEDGLAAAADVYGGLYAIIDGAEDILFDEDFNNLPEGTENIEYYVAVLDAYDPSLVGLPTLLTQSHNELKEVFPSVSATYREATRAGDVQVVSSVILSTAELVEKSLNFIKTALDVVQFYNDRSLAGGWQPNQPDLVESHLEQLMSYQSTLNGWWLDLVAVVNTIKSQSSTVKVSNLDLRSQELAIDKAKNDLAEAQVDLTDTYLRAPIAGIITGVEIESGEVVGANATIAELITGDQFEIEAFVPEASIALVKLGDPAEVTLDAYGERVVFGAEVLRIDPAETVRDGVPTYKVTFQFDEPDERIKSGMTANILVTARRKPEVLLVPTGAVKNDNEGEYVLIKTTEEVLRRPVTTGLRSSFGEVEILSGLTAGEEVVLRGSGE